MLRQVPLRCLPLCAATAMLMACNQSADEPAATPQQAEAAAPAPVLTTAPTPTAAPDGTALVAGVWAISEDGEGARALYAEEGLSPSLQLECPRGAFAVTLFVANGATEPQSWRLDAGGEAARIDLAPTTQPAQGLSAAVDQGLGIINALGADGQSFTLTAPDGQRLQFPTNPGIRRVIDACRFVTH